VDVGSAHVACALAAGSGDSMDVHAVPGRPAVLLSAESVTAYGIRGGEVVDLERAAETLRIATQAVLERAGVSVRRAVVSFSGPARLSIARGTLPFAGGPRGVRSADIVRLRQSLYADGGPGRRVVHRFDGPYTVGELAGVEQPLGLLGAGLSMPSTFLTAPATPLEHLRRALRGAKLELEDLALAPYAASLGALSGEERALGAAALDFGAGAFRGVLWEGGRLRQMHVSNQDRPAPPVGVTPAPDGMEGVFLAVARRFRLAPATARRLVQEHGAVCQAPSALVRAVEATAVDGLSTVWVELGELSRTLEELLAPPIRALRDALPLFSASHAGGVILCGGGARLQGLSRLVARHFGGAPVRVSIPRWESEAPLPDELTGPGGSTLAGLIELALASRSAAGRASRWAWWPRWPTALRRVAAAW
jgi:cell division protein FtsA